MAPRSDIDPRLIAAAIVAAVVLGAVIALLAPLPEIAQPCAQFEPPAGDVSALLEEARRITREAAG